MDRLNSSQIKMRMSAILAFVVAILFAQKVQADSCFVPSGNNVALSKGCTSGKATIFSKMDEFTVKIDADKGEPKEWSGSLAFKGCEMKLDLNRGSARSILSVDGTPINLPATATIKKGSASISNDGMPLFSLSASCSPNFKKAGSGNTIDVSYSMGPADSPLSMVFNRVSIYSDDDSSSIGAKAGIIIGVLVFAFLVCLSVGGGFFFFRRRKKQARLAKEKEELEKKKTEPEKKKDERKKTKDELDKTQDELEKTKDEPEKPEVKKKDELEKTKDELEKTQDELEKTQDEPEKEEPKKEDPIVKQVDETRPKRLEDTPVFKHIMAQKKKSLPSDGWPLDLDATGKHGPAYKFANGAEYTPRKDRRIANSLDETAETAPVDRFANGAEHIPRMKHQGAKRLRSRKSKKSRSSKPKKAPIEEKDAFEFVEPQDTFSVRKPYHVSEEARRIANMISPPKDNRNYN